MVCRDSGSNFFELLNIDIFDLPKKDARIEEPLVCRGGIFSSLSAGALFLALSLAITTDISSDWTGNMIEVIRRMAEVVFLFTDFRVSVQNLAVAI